MQLLFCPIFSATLLSIAQRYCSFGQRTNPPLPLSQRIFQDPNISKQRIKKRQDRRPQQERRNELFQLPRRDHERLSSSEQDALIMTSRKNHRSGMEGAKYIEEKIEDDERQQRDGTFRSRIEKIRCLASAQFRICTPFLVSLLREPIACVLRFPRRNRQYSCSTGFRRKARRSRSWRTN